MLNHYAETTAMTTLNPNQQPQRKPNSPQTSAMQSDTAQMKNLKLDLRVASADLVDEQKSDHRGVLPIIAASPVSPEREKMFRRERGRGRERGLRGRQRRKGRQGRRISAQGPPDRWGRKPPWPRLPGWSVHVGKTARKNRPGTKLKRFGKI